MAKTALVDRDWLLAYAIDWIPISRDAWRLCCRVCLAGSTPVASDTDVEACSRMHDGFATGHRACLDRAELFLMSGAAASMTRRLAERTRSLGDRTAALIERSMRIVNTKIDVRAH